MKTFGQTEPNDFQITMVNIMMLLKFFFLSGILMDQIPLLKKKFPTIVSNYKTYRMFKNFNPFQIFGKKKI